MRPARLRLTLALLLVGLLLPCPARAESREFSLPAQSAANALLAFSRQSGLEVLFSYDELSQVTSTAVIGRYEPEVALGRLLHNTGFAARRSDKGK